MIRYTRSFLIACALCAIAAPATAQISVDITTGVRSEYTLIYSGIVAYDEPVVQGDLWWTLPRGFWADMWYSTDFQLQDNFGRELDYGFGWSGDHVQVGGYYFDIMQQFTGNPDGDVVDIFVKWSTSIELGSNRLSPFIEANYFFMTRGPASYNGSQPNAGISHHWSILKSLNVDQDVALVYDGSLFGSDRGFVGRYQASLTTHPASWLSLRAPHFRVHTPLSPSIHDRETEPVVGLDVVFHQTIVEAKE